MAALLTRIWGGIKAVAKLIFPVLGKAGKSSALRWVLHFIVLALALVGLYFLGTVPAVQRAIIKLPTELKPFYPPALGLLVYGLIWLAWYLWSILATEEEESPYPDIDTAWSEAMRALEQGGYDIKSAPLYVVFGRPAGGETALFDASGMRLTIRGAPPRVAAPLHVYAGPDAILVTCAGASLLGDLADILSGVKEPILDGEADGQQSMMLGGGTRLPNANFMRMQKILREAGGRKLSEDERRELGKLCERDEARQGHMVDRAKQSLLKDPHKVAEASARLKQLCKLIVRDRRPFCSVNGLLFLIPVGGAASDSDASLTGEICQRDLATARAALQMDCPVFTLVCDMETVAGFREFRASFAAEELNGRLGQSYPFVPDVRDGEAATSIDKSIQWIGDATIPGWVYKFFQVEKTASREEAAEAVRKNARLYHFLGTIRERIRRLSRIITHGLLKQENAQPMFPGCYLAGTGRAEADQAFAAGVFRRLLREDAQNAVAWTQQALDQEAEYQRMLTIGYIVLAVLAVADAALIVWAIMGLGK
jgi:hypothetical protein